MSMVIEVKGIKAKKLNEETIYKEISKALTAEANEIEKEYKQTTRGWKHKPKFQKVKNIDITGQKAEVIVGTDDKIYGYVDLGTRAHFVPKSGKALMAFKPGYMAKTNVGQIRTSGARWTGAFGKRIVRYGRWKVGGIQARRFSEIIQKRRNPKFRDAMIEAIRVGSHKSNWDC